MATKKYYWLRLKRDFFKRHDIMVIESMPNGKDYVLFYLKLLVESIDHEGQLRFSETIPYNEQMLATITNTNIDIVRAAMKIFQELELIEILDDSTIYMSEVDKLIGSETDEHIREGNRIRQQRYRDNQKALRNVTVTLHRNVEKEIEKEIDIDKNKGRFTAPTVEEVRTYIQEKGYHFDAESFVAFYESKGWKVGSQPMKNWRSACVTWEKRRDEKQIKGNNFHNFEERCDSLDYDVLANFDQMMNPPEV